MTGHRTFIAMFRALDCLNDESSNEQLKEFLSDANVYLFKDRNAAVKDIQNKFIQYFYQNTNEEAMSVDEAYKIVKIYLIDNYSFGEVFTNISIDEWRALCRIINDECN